MDLDFWHCFGMKIKSMSNNHRNMVANSLDPEQTAPEVRTVCSDLSVPILTKFLVAIIVFGNVHAQTDLLWQVVRWGLKVYIITTKPGNILNLFSLHLILPHSK